MFSDAADATTPAAKRRRQLNVDLGNVVTEDRDHFFLDDIIVALKKDRSIIPDVWHMIRNNKLKKSTTPKKTCKLDLPTSANKINFISKDRLEKLLMLMEPALNEQHLKSMPKPMLCRMLVVAVHCEEESAVPSKDWDVLAANLKDWYQKAGARLRCMQFLPDSSLVVMMPDYRNYGIFSLVLNENGTHFISLRHWCGAIIDLPRPSPDRLLC